MEERKGFENANQNYEDKINQKETSKYKTNTETDCTYVEERKKYEFEKKSIFINKISVPISLNFIRHKSKEKFENFNNKNTWLISWKLI